MNMISSIRSKTFVTFCTIGAVATAVQYAVLLFSVKIAGLEPLPGSSIGFAVSAIVNYLLNRAFTYSDRSSPWRSAPRFLLMVIAGGVLNALCMAALGALSLHYLICQVIATGCVLAFNFVVSSTWVFSKAPSAG